MKRVISLVLCFIMIGAVFTGCAGKKDENDKGAYIYMYLTDMVYDLDPASAYSNESSLKLVSLLFDNLFVLDDNGKVKKSLAKDYEIVRNENAKEYTMIITLNSTQWSDGIDISANDVVYAWKRILNVENSSPAASLLFDIKNARAVKHGDLPIDDLGVDALNENQVRIEFEGDIDYDQFLLNLTSYALVPLREEIVERTMDWAKKPSTMVSSGPFRVRGVTYEDAFETDASGNKVATALRGLTLERNSYYYRDIMKDAVDKSVTPYRLIIDYSMTGEEIMQAYENGSIFYVGDIPLSLRNQYKESAEISDALSSHSYVLNQNAVVRYYDASGFETLSSDTTVYDPSLVEGTDGDKIFADAKVRNALSLAIDRNAIADAVVFAKAATGLIPYGVFEADSAKKSFRKVGGDLIASDADMSAAKQLLSEAGIDPSKYMFAISVAAYDEVHMCIAEMVQKAWQELGFKVAINAIQVIQNDDYYAATDETPKDIMDDVFAENYRAGLFEVAAVDLVAMSCNALPILAAYAKEYSGEGMDMTTLDYKLTPHISGYDSEAYNEKIEAAYGETDTEKRAVLLHEAEKMIVDDMPVIPIIFNQNATLTSKQLSKVTFSYYGAPSFKKAKLKDYEDYLPVETE
ncbi:MAG: ABC transporter substrate-binding protein [Eubacteriales bacterium]